MEIKDTYINYVQYGKAKGQDIVMLHGWGQNIEMMDPIGQRLKDYFRITILDWPGFGDSPEPSFAWSVIDYYEMLVEFLEKLKIKDPIIIGHSFGGRIAIIYAAKEKVKKLVLLAAPFRRTNKKATVKVKVLKTLKKVPLLNKLENYVKGKIGSTDYKNATPIMRKVLVNVINENLSFYLDKIKTPTLLIWGSNDSEVPLKEARYLESIIKDCGLVIYKGCSHYAYLERINQTISIFKEFFKNDKDVI